MPILKKVWEGQATNLSYLATMRQIKYRFQTKLCCILVKTRWINNLSQGLTWPHLTALLKNLMIGRFFIPHIKATIEEIVFNGMAQNVKAVWSHTRVERSIARALVKTVKFYQVDNSIRNKKVITSSKHILVRLKVTPNFCQGFLTNKKVLLAVKD